VAVVTCTDLDIDVDVDIDIPCRRLLSRRHTLNVRRDSHSVSPVECLRIEINHTDSQ